MFYQKEEIQKMLSQEEEIKAFAKELMDFRDRQKEILQGIKMLDFDEVLEIVDRFKKAHPKVPPS